MDREPVAVPEATPVSVALEEFFVRYGWDLLPVIDDAGRLTGIARLETLQRASDAGDGRLSTSAFLAPVAIGELSVREEGSVAELLASEPLRLLGVLMVVDATGVLRGIVTSGRVRRALGTELGLLALRR